jgi:hypothetical protein
LKNPYCRSNRSTSAHLTSTSAAVIATPSAGSDDPSEAVAGLHTADRDDPRELAGLIVPDFDAFWWSEPAARAAGREVFGF